jgi:hypothetical protein
MLITQWRASSSRQVFLLPLELREDRILGRQASSLAGSRVNEPLWCVGDQRRQRID